MEPTEKKINGAFIGLTIIVLILIVGGVYIWKQIELKKAVEQPASQNTQTSNVVTPQDNTQVDNLTKELNNTDTNIGVDVNTVK